MTTWMLPERPLPSTACFGRALDAYTSRELTRVDAFRAGRPMPPGVPTTALMLALQGEEWGGQAPTSPLGLHDFLLGLAWGLRHVAELDAELHDVALAQLRQVQDDLHKYDND